MTKAKKKILAELEQNIGMLRQWLNEERIDDVEKFVTNKELKHWLSLSSALDTMRDETLEEVKMIYEDYASADLYETKEQAKNTKRNFDYFNSKINKLKSNKEITKGIDYEDFPLGKDAIENAKKKEPR